MTINPGAAEWPHRQIAGQLRTRIRRGDWQPGERLPSIPAIAETYGVAKQTVQRAIDQLRVEGLLITKPGSGTYVRGTRRTLNRLSRGRYGPVRGYHADLPGRYRIVSLGVSQEPAPADIAAGFGLADGSTLLVRRYLVRTPEDQVVEVGASWLLPRDAAGTSLERDEPFGRPLYQEVEDETGRRYVHAADQLTARLPTRAEAEILQIRPDTPVLVLLHLAYDEHHRPIEVTQSTWPGPTTVLGEEYKIPAPQPEPSTTEPGFALG